MSKEYIEKEAAINYLTLNMCWYDEEGGQVEDWDERKAIISDLLDGIPPADVKPVVKGEWIPVTERLPEIDMTFPHSEWYLVQYEDGYMDVASWSNVNRFWTDLVTEPHWNCAQFQTVVAWMSLPEPYRKEEANDNEDYA